MALRHACSTVSYIGKHRAVPVLLMEIKLKKRIQKFEIKKEMMYLIL